MNTQDAVVNVPPSSAFAGAAAEPGADAQENLEPANVPDSTDVVDAASTTGRMTPLQAVRAKCLDCSGGSRQEVRLCPITRCPLWPYRFGKRPERRSDP
jgi:hypothetical protein